MLEDERSDRGPVAPANGKGADPVDPAHDFEPDARRDRRAGDGSRETEALVITLTERHRVDLREGLDDARERLVLIVDQEGRRQAREFVEQGPEPGLHVVTLDEPARE